MRIREYTPADLDALRRMHASQNFDYAFPNLDDPIFISKLILEDDTGRPVMAALARLTCEMYLLIDRTTASDLSSRGPSSAEGSAVGVRLDDLVGAQHAVPGENTWQPGNDSASVCGSDPAPSPRQRFEWLLALHRAGEQDLLARGLDDAHAWLPPQIAKRFGRRLESLGWLRDNTWTPYCKRLKTSG